MTRYYYDPKVRRDNEGNYCVDVYKYSRGKSHLVCSLVKDNYRVALLNVKEAVFYCNEYEKKLNFFKRLFS